MIKLKDTECKPPWHLVDKTINTTLHNYVKACTDSTLFRKLFQEIQSEYKHFTFIFTDASKMNDSTSFSVIQNTKIIKNSLLPNYTSIFTAEIIAIMEALNSIMFKNGFFAICTDSLSSLKAILNTTNNNIYATIIRNILIKKYPNIILIWTPGHCQIKGNEFADKTAKEALNAPLLMTNNYSKTDINKFLKHHYSEDNNLFEQTSNWYRNINSNKLSVEKFIKGNVNDIDRRDFIKFERLRLGHSKVSHGHLVNLPPPQICGCNITAEMYKHIFSTCPKYRKQRLEIFKDLPDPLSLLTNPSKTNITKILTFLRKTNTYNLI